MIPNRVALNMEIKSFHVATGTIENSSTMSCVIKPSPFESKDHMDGTMSSRQGKSRRLPPLLSLLSAPTFVELLHYLDEPGTFS